MDVNDCVIKSKLKYNRVHYEMIPVKLNLWITFTLHEGHKKWSNLIMKQTAARVIPNIFFNSASGSSDGNDGMEARPMIKVQLQGHSFIISSPPYPIYAV